ncbi:MFS transporter [Bacillus shivajii]|uniref:MFS transporter n=1 Tax=Bacillus shivajii TaxID=1983719 RepID=UPI001CFB33FB|nr:MFS transporter [Bacillus shivajii]UCZ54325.1 MFS transporter [Bacillus shivajii]
MVIKQKFVLFILLFLIFTSMHMQFPVFTPLAVSLGAGSFLIGVMLSVTSFVNLGGNLVAGNYIDKYGAKVFITIPLLLMSISLLLHTLISESTHLFALRVLNGLILAFLTPACMTLLSSYAKTNEEQSKNMAMNTLMITAAMTTAPVAGGIIGERAGADGTYLFISAVTFLAFMIAYKYLHQPSLPVKKTNVTNPLQIIKQHSLLPVFLTAFAVMFAQGTLMYELPFLSVEAGLTKGEVGKNAAYMGIGTFFILSFVLLHKLNTRFRILLGLFSMSASFMWMMFTAPVVSVGSLILFGISTGILFPAMMTLLTENVMPESRGKAFAVLSAVFSVGTISSPFIAGAVRDVISPYFIAWIIVMLAVTSIGLLFIEKGKKPYFAHS